jgi:hypothetical protein
MGTSKYKLVHYPQGPIDVSYRTITICIYPLTINDMNKPMVRLAVSWVEEDPIVLEVEKMYTCWDCMDTRETENIAYDSDSHNYYSDGTRPCHCVSNNDDYDPDAND